MSFITAVIGGKAVGVADQVTIDPSLGCKNMCVGCYARKTSRKGEKFNVIKNKELDKEILTKSVQLVRRKGYRFARVGKHCDPAACVNTLNSIIDICSGENLRCVIVSKLLRFNSKTAKLLREGNHILHISLGPYTDKVHSEEERIKEAKAFSKAGCKTFIRLTRDVTQWITPFDKKVSHHFDTIVTPMRYASKEDAAFYKSNLENFSFENGYYRPKLIHPSWEGYIDNICGEINSKIYCCNCLTGETL